MDSNNAMEIITHSELVSIGAKWLSKFTNYHYRCLYVCKELTFQGASEIPDILGLRPHGNIVIEVKVSRADFSKDKRKKARQPKAKCIGERRLFLCPKGLISVNELPEGWGLLEYEQGYVTMTQPSEKFEEDKQMSIYAYHSILRRKVKPCIF